jgi:hypothetical protein
LYTTPLTESGIVCWANENIGEKSKPMIKTAVNFKVFIKLCSFLKFITQSDFY